MSEGGREGREGGSICTCTLLSLFLFTFHDEMNPHQSSQNSLELKKTSTQQRYLITINNQRLHKAVAIPSCD